MRYWAALGTSHEVWGGTGTHSDRHGALTSGGAGGGWDGRGKAGAGGKGESGGEGEPGGAEGVPGGLAGTSGGSW